MIHCRKLAIIGACGLISWPCFAETIISPEDQPTTILRPVIQSPGSIVPGCSGPVVCWSVKSPEANDRYHGTDYQNALDNAAVRFGNWLGTNSIEVYTASQVNARIEAIRKEFDDREKKLAEQIRNEMQSEIDAKIAAKLKER